MAYFMAGVAKADIFKGGNMFATAKTLIDSSITIGISAEDVRAGQGAKLAGKYFHSATFDLKMSDAMFKLEYIAANIGSEITIGGDALVNKKVTAVGGLITLPTVAVALTGSTIYAYATLEGTENYQTFPVTNNTITVPVSAGTYCVKYVETKIAGRKLVIGGAFTPDTLYVMLTANLYAGDSSNPSTGTKVGEVVIKVPRFLLAGSQELSMSMTGASNTAFEGSALVNEDAGCDGEGYYAEIMEVLTNSKWYDDAKALIIEDNDVSITTGSKSITPNVYVIYNGSKPKKIDNTIINNGEVGLSVDEQSRLVFSAVSAGTTGLSINASTGVISGTATAGSATFRVKAVKGSSNTQIASLDSIMVVTVS
jgi:hypothetical protein